ncbi:STAS domain-containing protein [Rhodococcoides trifolii]|uniref:STAS domain-containing protein n=1 Tax=Rhodococcoides trifolii TaxID=908250 RepID=UPI001E638381|nr:STAS domain-containing protein [Rhodococcus trifolii]
MSTDAALPSSDAFEVLVSHHGTTVLMSVSGELDMVTAPQLTESVDAVMSGDPQRVVIDLSDVRFLASSGMSVLLDVNDRLSDAHFAVIADGPNTARPLELVGLNGTFTIYTTLDAALAASASADDSA